LAIPQNCHVIRFLEFGRIRPNSKKPITPPPTVIAMRLFRLRNKQRSNLLIAGTGELFILFMSFKSLFL